VCIKNAFILENLFSRNSSKCLIWRSCSLWMTHADISSALISSLNSLEHVAKLKCQKKFTGSCWFDKNSRKVHKVPGDQIIQTIVPKQNKKMQILSTDFSFHPFHKYISCFTADFSCLRFELNFWKIQVLHLQALSHHMSYTFVYSMRFRGFFFSNCMCVRVDICALAACSLFYSRCQYLSYSVR